MKPFTKSFVMHPDTMLELENIGVRVETVVSIEVESIPDLPPPKERTFAGVPLILDPDMPPGEIRFVYLKRQN